METYTSPEQAEREYPDYALFPNIPIKPRSLKEVTNYQYLHDKVGWDPRDVIQVEGKYYYLKDHDIFRERQRERG